MLETTLIVIMVDLNPNKIIILLSTENVVVFIRVNAVRHERYYHGKRRSNTTSTRVNYFEQTSYFSSIPKTTRAL